MHRLTYCYLVDPVDRPRLAALHVVADMQLSPSSLTDSYEESLLNKIGEDRCPAPTGQGIDGGWSYHCIEQ